MTVTAMNGSPVGFAVSSPAPVRGLGGHVVGAGPSLPPSKRKPGSTPSTKSGVLQNALDKEDAKRKAIGKVATRSASAHIAE